ncbi:mitochondrial fission factor-like isoform X3 [Tachysurus fulvidraco]|uniref:mitochondrial fission factor-like isoform X3 n=1 Tax=Tachysurus fulvidraco TaxID=1234273 RepID=UPI001FEF5A49|nr:mitochondrial fission factor-like isoform X3 [Tachysurus fulvidraco]
MTAPVYIVDGSPLRDPHFTAAISERMRVPERLRVAQGALEDLKARAEELPAAFSMHVPDRLALTDAPDLSPRPLFSHHNARGYASSMWNLQQGPWDRETFTRGHVQSPLRRSYSDQTFGRTPSGTPTHSKHSSSGSQSAGTMLAVPTVPALPESRGLGAIAPVLLTPHSILQAAKKLGKQASDKILQTVTQKYSSSNNTQEFWRSPEEESGTTVEFIALRRQMIKMNRRIASLEKQNGERKQNELLLFSLLLSACLVNGWFWMRK